MSYRKKLLLETLKVQTSSYETENMQIYIEMFLDEHGISFVNDDGNIYATKGFAETYPCVVAHTDTVHDMYDDFHIIEHDDYWMAVDGETMTQVGIGGDDKVGVFVALAMLKELDVVKAAFFKDEEVGCVGSAQADMSFFDNVGYALQFDRRGYGDVVTACGTTLSGQEFQDAVMKYSEGYGLKLQPHGGLTDVVQLKENGLKCAAANFSCGYYRPHTKQEIIDFVEVMRITHFCLEFITDHPDTMFEHVDEWHWGATKDDSVGKFPEPSEDEYGMIPCPGCGSRETCIDYSSMNQDLYCFTCDTSSAMAEQDDRVDIAKALDDYYDEKLPF